VGTVIIFETHSLTEDNDSGIATGWLSGRLSSTGREYAAALGRRRAADGLAAVFSSDLGRAMETAAVAFADSDLPILADWRLRECDYGDLNGAPVEAVHANRSIYLYQPYPGGESWRAATDRVGRFLDDLPLRWEGTRVLVIGHVATRLGLERHLMSKDLAELLSSEFVWQEGWEYTLEQRHRNAREAKRATTSCRSKNSPFRSRAQQRWPRDQECRPFWASLR
jgi:2,3-bisphosphoglycerate-dependent phosphoglycerate mutase